MFLAPRTVPRILFAEFLLLCKLIETIFYADPLILGRLAGDHSCNVFRMLEQLPAIPSSDILLRVLAVTKEQLPEMRIPFAHNRILHTDKLLLFSGFFRLGCSRTNPFPACLALGRETEFGACRKRLDGAFGIVNEHRSRPVNIIPRKGFDSE